MTIRLSRHMSPTYTEAEWSAENPVLLDGEVGYATDSTPPNQHKVGDGATAWNSLAYVAGGGFPNPFALTADITPPALSGDVNDYEPTGLSTADVLRLEASGAARTITGLAGGADGREINLINIGAAFDIILSNQSVSSSAENRFSFGSGNFTLKPGTAIKFIYDSTALRWRPYAAVDHSAFANIGTNTHTNIDDHLASTSNPHGVTALQAGAIPVDGWILDSNTWTRTGDHTFTLSGDHTARLRKNVRVQYNDGAIDFGVIKSSSFAAGTTTVTLITNTSYAMAAATITGKYYSPISPPGFPAYFNYTTVITASGGGTITTYTIVQAIWSIIGDQIKFDVAFTITNKGTGVGTAQFSVPVSWSATGVGTGREFMVVGSMLQPIGTAGITNVDVLTYNNQTTLVNGYGLICSFINTWS